MKIAVITGASSGMGREFVHRIARDRELDEIWVIARRLERLESLQGEIANVKLRPIPLDLTKEESVQAYRTLLEIEKPEVEILVNCSGYGKFGSFEGLELEVHEDMIDLNVGAYVSMTYVTLPFMHSGGEIYQLVSIASFQPLPYMSIYAATKSFVLSFSRSLNVELKEKGIRVLAVCPGWVKTEFFDRAAATKEADAVTNFRHMVTPEQVIDRAMRDMRKGKDVSVCSAYIRAQALLTKLSSHRFVMRVWCKQQKK